MKLLAFQRQTLTIWECSADWKASCILSSGAIIVEQVTAAASPVDGVMADLHSISRGTLLSDHLIWYSLASDRSSAGAAEF